MKPKSNLVKQARDEVIESIMSIKAEMVKEMDGYKQDAHAKALSQMENRIAKKPWWEI